MLAILTGSFLLFLIQPMVARLALPRVGGAPAVWNSAMLVFQALLLAGYAYAHALDRLPPARGRIVHLAVLALAALTLPIGLLGWTLPAGAEPALWVPTWLTLSIGPLFFAVAAGAPLVQRWYALGDPVRDPYPLYAASNLGSFAGLLAYPLLLEPFLSVREQRIGWSIGFGILAFLLVAVSRRLPAGQAMRHAVTSPAPSGRQRLLWAALACVPSGLMLATTVHITTDIVAVPLIWVVPLGLYLLSFTVAFAERRWLAEALTLVAPVTILLFGGSIVGASGSRPFLMAGLALVLLFMASVALHTRLHALRPAPDRLTGFYLVMSAGGAAGGVLVAILAPLLFDWTWEYPLLVLAAGALVPMHYPLPALRRWWEGPRRRTKRLAVAALVLAVIDIGVANPLGLLGPGDESLLFLVVAAVGLLALGARVPYLLALAGAITLFGGYRSLSLTLEPGARTRSYFGVYTVRDQPGFRTLTHGTTIHGVEMTGGDRRRPTTYYGESSGVGAAMAVVPSLYGPSARIGIVGLGSGTLACYAQAGQDWRFYEIDPVVVEIARSQFTFLRHCLPQARVVIGDARISLARARPDSLDLLALDAFSSDAVPMHLLTTEALDTYGRALAPEGLLLVHISNRYLRLEPVVAAIAAARGWRVTMLDDRRRSDRSFERTGSTWLALSRRPGPLAALTRADARWEAVPLEPGVSAWTDDRAALLPVIRGF